MEYQKFIGKTLEEALQKAASEKEVSVEELTYTVTEEKAGFLGIGKTVEIQVFCNKDIQKFIHD